jgi:hypothetical protein
MVDGQRRPVLQARVSSTSLPDFWAIANTLGNFVLAVPAALPRVSVFGSNASLTRFGVGTVPVLGGIVLPPPVQLPMPDAVTRLEDLWCLDPSSTPDEKALNDIAQRLVHQVFAVMAGFGKHIRFPARHSPPWETTRLRVQRWGIWVRLGGTVYAMRLLGHMYP